MKTPSYPFIPAPKTPRLSREIIVTEKLDGCWSAVEIDDSGEIFAASRNRWITPESDNYGFAKWVEGNKTELLKFGPGRFPGEWWGLGIQRNYGLTEKRFSLFNASRWVGSPQSNWKEVLDLETGIRGPACVSVVPVLYRGVFSVGEADYCLKRLEELGSTAAPGFMNPEGIVVYHTAAKTCFKKTIKDDASPKSLI